MHWGLRLTKYLQGSRKIASPMEDIGQSVCIANVEPVPSWSGNHENITHFNVRFVLVGKFPTAPIEPSEVSRAEGNLFEKWDEEPLVHSHPDWILVTDRDDAKGNSNLSSNQIISKEAEPGP